MYTKLKEYPDLCFGAWLDDNNPAGKLSMIPRPNLAEYDQIEEVAP
jgi:hypothetical protein